MSHCVLAIDPGEVKSAFAILTPAGRVARSGYQINGDLRDLLEDGLSRDCAAFLIEDFLPWGQPATRHALNTCKWIGRFYETIYQYEGRPPVMVDRGKACQFMLGRRQVKKVDVKEFVISEYTTPEQHGVGDERRPGPLYRLKTDHEFDAVFLAMSWQSGWRP